MYLSRHLLFIHFYLVINKKKKPTPRIGVRNVLCQWKVQNILTVPTKMESNSTIQRWAQEKKKHWSSEKAPLTNSSVNICSALVGARETQKQKQNSENPDVPLPVFFRKGFLLNIRPSFPAPPSCWDGTAAELCITHFFSSVWNSTGKRCRMQKYGLPLPLCLG